MIIKLTISGHVPSKQHESRSVAKPLASTSRSPTRLRASLHPPHPVVSRSLTDTSQVPSLFVRFVVTKSRLSSLSASSHSSVLFARLPRTSRPTCVSSHQPLVRSRRLLRLTLSRSLRTPTFAPSTVVVSPFSPRTCSSLVVFAVSALKQ
jgi:hypothetical protein